MDHRAIDVGWRKVVRRVCIVDGKRARQVGELCTVLDGQAPDRVIAGLP